MGKRRCRRGRPPARDEYLSLNPGASYRGLQDSVVNYLGNERPQMILCLHEEHSVSIAHGYAKVTERPMAVAVHSNVGLMHASMALFNAFCDRMPMLVLGRPARSTPLSAGRGSTGCTRRRIRPRSYGRSSSGTISRRRPRRLCSRLRGGTCSRRPFPRPGLRLPRLWMQEAPLNVPVELPEAVRFGPASAAAR